MYITSILQVVDCGEPGNNAHSTVSSEITTYKGQAKYDCDRCYSTSDEVSSRTFEFFVRI